VTGEPETHEPAWQKSPWVQRLPSSQPVPLGFGEFEQTRLPQGPAEHRPKHPFPEVHSSSLEHKSGEGSGGHAASTERSRATPAAMAIPPNSAFNALRRVVGDARFRASSSNRFPSITHLLAQYPGTLTKGATRPVQRIIGSGQSATWRDWRAEIDAGAHDV
jgi:hypothetical protein